MAFYKISEMEPQFIEMGKATMKTVAGEYMKAGIVSYEVGDGPPPHFHPNEEQFILMLDGKVNMILGDETRVIGAGDMVHVPRNVRHGIRIVEGPAVFFTAKSPTGDGDLNQDYNLATDADEANARLEKV